MQDVTEKAKNIKLVIFDVDGVLTDGSLFVTHNGEEIKAFNSRDGHGMKMLQSTGVIVAIITGRTSNIVTHRMNELGIEHVYQGVANKYPAFVKLLEKLAITPQETAYVGDDVVDLPVMSHVGLAVAVQDAHEFVKKHAHWQTPACGGKGAARDVCELIMDAQGNLQKELESYLNKR
ncbi:MAG: 3-deoxy-manno-octulosonate-8-phosphatase KdsC [Gammaproteobacteria bacterium]|nr:3-deoxy-manno-octulosonate-8-phosphatase KdsC [Gammaproteobacteria bacterium]